MPNLNVKIEGKKGHYYHDFRVDGVRHHKSTESTVKRTAEAIALKRYEDLLKESKLGIKGSISLEDAIQNYLNTKNGAKLKTMRDYKLYTNRLMGIKLVKDQYNHDKGTHDYVSTSVSGGLKKSIKLEKIDNEIIDDMQSDLEKDDLGAEAVRKQINTLRAVIQLAERHGYRTNPKIVWKRQKRGQAKAIHLLEGEEHKLLEALKQSPNRENYLFGLMLLDTGMRTLEARRIALTDLIKNDAGEVVSIKVTRAKQASNRGSSKEQSVVAIVPVTKRLSEALKNYNSRSYQWLFLNQYGDTYRGKGDDWCTAAVRRAGLDDPELIKARNGKITPHILRHHYVFKLLDGGRGLSLEAIGQLIGHTSIETTRVYSSWVQSDVATNALEILERLND